MKSENSLRHGIELTFRHKSHRINLAGLTGTSRLRCDTDSLRAGVVMSNAYRVFDRAALTELLALSGRWKRLITPFNKY